MEIRNLIRQGVVSAVYPAKATVRVVFADRDNLVSAELPVLQGFGLKNKSYVLPDVNESVVCLMLPNGDDGQGFVLGSFYHEQSPPPAQSQDISMIRFADGSSISYDRAKHELSINVNGTIRIKGRQVFIN